ncbi:hypothetical protein PILCRDRAFT_4552 [Piloderma croceum F 1598]|uniref:Uncharacterized protein n=1 Tax=Piloderma croceum (strain F 1598) TaxID=765440 RepID=A0A0C3G7M4_PILCF|nr:hypothetical protein PILCRDRAFT_4552 [Piloderma croceum F 1598]
MAEFNFPLTYTFNPGFTVSFDTDASAPGAFSFLSPSDSPPQTGPSLDSLLPFPFDPTPGGAIDPSLLLPPFAASAVGPSPIPTANMNFDEWLASEPAMGLGSPTTNSINTSRLDASQPAPMMPTENTLIERTAQQDHPRASPLRSPSPPQLPPVHSHTHSPFHFDTHSRSLLPSINLYSRSRSRSRSHSRSRSRSRSHSRSQSRSRSRSRSKSPVPMNGMDIHSHSWAARNPTRPVLQPRPGGRKLTEVQKASRNIAREASNIKKKALDDDIKAFMENQAEKIEELARTHNTKPKRIKEMIGAVS